MWWTCGNHRLELGQKPLVMGILNVSPDSFSDGSENHDAAIRLGLQLAQQGADMIDVGGESTRPGSSAVDEDVEIARVVPVVQALSAQIDIPISIDTRRLAVAQAATAAGASIVNHVTASLNVAEFVPWLVSTNVGYIAMHTPGLPKHMQAMTDYSNGVVEAVVDSLAKVKERLCFAGVNAKRILYDPGIGFGKTLDQNLTLLRSCETLAIKLGRPLVMGLSRKSWLGKLLDVPVSERDPYSVMASLLLCSKSVAVHRVHHVEMMCRGLQIQSSLEQRQN